MPSSSDIENNDLFTARQGGYWNYRIPCLVATGPGHGLQLRNQRLVVPVWLSDGTGGEFGPKYRGHRPSILASI